MHRKYIVTSGGLYGHWGQGATLTDAVENWRKAGGKKKDGNYRVQQFVATLPFAPSDREALATEADAWVGRDGSMNWIRCQRQE